MLQMREGLHVLLQGKGLQLNWTISQLTKEPKKHSWNWRKQVPSMALIQTLRHKNRCKVTRSIVTYLLLGQWFHMHFSHTWHFFFLSVNENCIKKCQKGRTKVHFSHTWHKKIEWAHQYFSFMHNKPSQFCCQSSNSFSIPYFHISFSSIISPLFSFSSSDDCIRWQGWGCNLKHCNKWQPVRLPIILFYFILFFPLLFVTF